LRKATRRGNVSRKKKKEKNQSVEPKSREEKVECRIERAVGK